MNPIHPQLAAILDELAAATAHARRLAEATDEEGFRRRPAAGSWSAAECLAHLNLTTRAYLPLIEAALGQSSARVPPATRRYRCDLKGRLLCWMVEPPFRMKVKTAAPFVPSSPAGKGELLAEFESLQDQLARRVTAAGGHDLNRLKIASPFAARLKYNLYSAFKVIPAHQRRHLWQADQALARVAAAKSG